MFKVIRSIQLDMHETYLELEALLPTIVSCTDFIKPHKIVELQRGIEDLLEPTNVKVGDRITVVLGRAWAVDFKVGTVIVLDKSGKKAIN